MYKIQFDNEFIPNKTNYSGYHQVKVKIIYDYFYFDYVLIKFREKLLSWFLQNYFVLCDNNERKNQEDYVYIPKCLFVFEPCIRH